MATADVIPDAPYRCGYCGGGTFQPPMVVSEHESLAPYCARPECQSGHEADSAAQERQQAERRRNLDTRRREAVGRVLSALDGLIADELQGGDPGRYERVTAICDVARRVKSMRSGMRSSDYAELFACGGPEGALAALPRAAGNDQMDIMREMVGVLQQTQRMTGDRDRSQELESLLRSRDLLEPGTDERKAITARIQALLKQIGENKHAPTDGVADPELLRRREGGAPGRADVPRGDDHDDAAGA